MSKVTSKLQVTIPKALAEKYGIRPGTELEWVAAGDSIHVLLGEGPKTAMSIPERLELFDRATERRDARQRGAVDATASTERGWTRDELYDRG